MTSTLMPVLASNALAISSCFAILAGWTSVVQNLISAKLVLVIRNTRANILIMIFLIMYSPSYIVPLWYLVFSDVRDFFIAINLAV